MGINGMDNIVKNPSHAQAIGFGMQLMSNVFVGIDIIGVVMVAYQFQHAKVVNIGIQYWWNVSVTHKANGMENNVYYVKMGKFGIQQI